MTVNLNFQFIKLELLSTKIRTSILGFRTPIHKIHVIATQCPQKIISIYKIFKVWNPYPQKFEFLKEDNGKQAHVIF